MDIVNTVADRTYYRLTFIDIEDGAALVAAVSRFLASPQGAVFGAAPYEVSAECNAESSELHLYLSSAALDAVVQGFGTPDGVVALAAITFPRPGSCYLDTAIARHMAVMISCAV